MQTLETSVNALIQQIVEMAHPLRIILFGSAARGGFRQGSDVDLLVVMPEGTHRRQTAQRLYAGIRDAGVPFDLVVATPGDLDRHGDKIGLVYRDALREGKEVYVAG